jgi:UDP-glucose:(heptosyl)LPS alpha-1,3-glucosyltransferase
MKIALVILHADPRRGGAERYTVDLAEALAARGHVVSVVATSFPVMLSPTVTMVHLPTSGLRAARYRSFLTQFENHLHIAPYDVIHAMLPLRKCDVYHPHAGLAIEAVRTGHRKHRNPLSRGIARVNNALNPRRRAYAAVEKRALTGKRRPVVLCLSDYVKQSVRKYYPLDEDHLATLFNAVDLAKFDPAARAGSRAEVRRRHGIAPAATVAVMIAQDFARKGLASAIQALAQTRQSGGGPDTLLVVGDDHPGPYRRLARRLGVADRVIFAGRTDDPPAVYAASDFFVLPTYHDPCSLVVLEALAMGLPVITTKQNGAAEIMTDGVHGQVLDHADAIPGLATAMRTLTDPATRARARAACLGLRPRLSFDRHVDELLGIYDRAPGHWS